MMAMQRKNNNSLYVFYFERDLAGGTELAIPLSQVANMANQGGVVAVPTVVFSTADAVAIACVTLVRSVFGRPSAEQQERVCSAFRQGLLGAQLPSGPAGPHIHVGHEPDASEPPPKKRRGASK